MKKPCKACGGRRFIIANLSAIVAPGGRLEIQRCDECSLDLSDADVRRWPQAKQALKKAQENQR